jgi:hypothetical protein
VKEILYNEFLEKYNKLLETASYYIGFIAFEQNYDIVR